MNQSSWIFVVVGTLLIFTMSCSLLDLSTPEPTVEATVEDQTEAPSVDQAEGSAAESVDEPTPQPPTSTPEQDKKESEAPPLADQTSESGATLEITNDSEAAITELFISPVTSETWGENWLQASLEIGESRTIVGIPEDVYDIQAGNPNAETAETLYNVVLESENTWTIVGTATVPDDANLRFEDDFSDNRNTWGDIDDGDINYRAPDNGEYCIDIRVAEMTAWEWYEPFRTEEFFAEVKCVVDPETDASCGLGYGTDSDNLVWYETDASTQSYALFLLENDAWDDPLIDWTGDQHISPDGENYLGLGRLGETLFLYVNGVLIDRVEADLFADGRIGIGGATYADPDVTICLDDLRVWQIGAASGTEPPADTEAPAETEEPAVTEEPAASANAPLEIVWEGPMGYEGREGQTQWCEMKMTYRNVSGATINWPDYRPLFLILNGDGSEDGWYYANYYHKEDGWENGIEGEPPPVAPDQGANWTWYSSTERADQYCAGVAVEYQGWIYQATYGPQGALLDTQVIAP